MAPSKRKRSATSKGVKKAARVGQLESTPEDSNALLTAQDNNEEVEEEEEEEAPVRKTPKITLRLPKVPERDEISEANILHGRPKRAIRMTKALEENLAIGQQTNCGIPIVPRRVGEEAMKSVQPRGAKIGKRAAPEDDDDHVADAQPAVKKPKLSLKLRTSRSCSNIGQNQRQVASFTDATHNSDTRISAARETAPPAAGIGEVPSNDRAINAVSDNLDVEEGGEGEEEKEEASASQENASQTGPTPIDVVGMEPGSIGDLRNPLFTYEDRKAYPDLDFLLGRWEAAEIALLSIEKLATDKMAASYSDTPHRKLPVEQVPDEDVQRAFGSLRLYHNGMRKEHANRRRKEINNLLGYYVGEQELPPLGFLRFEIWGPQFETAKWFYWEKTTRDRIWKENVIEKPPVETEEAKKRREAREKRTRRTINGTRRRPIKSAKQRKQEALVHEQLEEPLALLTEEDRAALALVELSRTVRRAHGVEEEAEAQNHNKPGESAQSDEYAAHAASSSLKKYDPDPTELESKSLAADGEGGQDEDEDEDEYGDKTEDDIEGDEIEEGM